MLIFFAGEYTHVITANGPEMIPGEEEGELSMGRTGGTVVSSLGRGRWGEEAGRVEDEEVE